MSSVNSYGYSPYPLATYLEWIYWIIQSDPDSTKPFIISITSTSESSLSSMLDAIQDLRAKICDSEGPTSRIAIELNTSCPNIKGSPPPSYNFQSLKPLLNVLAAKYWADTTLTIGLKLPPYIYSTQFEDVVNIIANYTLSPDFWSGARNAFAFFTCTNTLGSSLLFTEQTDRVGSIRSPFALPTVTGGLAGESIHALSLGNVHSFAKLLSSSDDAAVRGIEIIGVGGVTSPEAASRMRQAGAKVVGCATLLGREGVKAFETLSK